jgi:hypothetical protein
MGIYFSDVTSEGSSKTSNKNKTNRKCSSQSRSLCLHMPPVLHQESQMPVEVPNKYLNIAFSSGNYQAEESVWLY